MAFWGCILKPGVKAKVEHPEGDILHLSQACLHSPQDGKNFIQVEVDGKKYAIACLEKGKKEHDSFDLFFNPDSCSFSNLGKSEVHLTGYFEPDEDMDDEGSEEDAPAAKVSSPKASPKTAPVAAKVQSPKVTASSPKKQPVPAPESDDDDLSMECEEEEEMSNEDDEELGDDDLEDEEEEEEDDDSEELAPPPKKQKVEPAKAVAGSPKAAVGGGEMADYLKKLTQYLRENGKTSISALGSKVPRPKDVPKMKVVFEQNKDKFTVEGDSVSVK